MLVKEKDILSIKEQYELRDRFLAERLEEVLPDIMEECGVNLWVVLCSEYHEDPVFRCLTPAPCFTRTPLAYMVTEQVPSLVYTIIRAPSKIGEKSR